MYTFANFSSNYLKNYDRDKLISYAEEGRQWNLIWFENGQNKIERGKFISTFKYGSSPMGFYTLPVWFIIDMATKDM